MTEDKNEHFAGKYFEEIDKISEENNYFTPVLKEVLQKIDIKNSKVLDVGCGTGLFLRPLILAGCSQLYGVDGPQNFTKRAIKRGYRGVKIVSDLNVSNLPSSDESFDLVICKDVFEHLVNPTHTLTEIRRVLKTGGLLLLHVPNHFPLIGRLKFLFTNNIDTFHFFKKESRWTFPHIRFFEHYDSLQVLALNNFSLVCDLSYHFPSIPFLSRFKSLSFLGKCLVKIFPNQFASGFTFLVKKV
jgi:ubiquinone/menaquinone biosynthesis C-methylase UbiE